MADIFFYIFSKDTRKRFTISVLDGFDRIRAYFQPIAAARNDIIQRIFKFIEFHPVDDGSDVFHFREQRLAESALICKKIFLVNRLPSFFPKRLQTGFYRQVTQVDLISG